MTSLDGVGAEKNAVRERVRALLDLVGPGGGAPKLAEFVETA